MSPRNGAKLKGAHLFMSLTLRIAIKFKLHFYQQTVKYAVGVSVESRQRHLILAAHSSEVPLNRLSAKYL